MAFDGIFTHDMVQELNQALTGGRISKIQQPYEKELYFTIRNHRTNFKLLISAHSEFARIHLSEESYPNPDTAPNFCMVLRKYCEGAIIHAIKQLDNDRIVHFDLLQTDEIGDQQQLTLVVEIMGRHSNVFLLDHENDIIDCLKHIPMYLNSYRTLLPNHPYQEPPRTIKVNPFIAGDQAKPLMDDAKSLMTYYEGIGKETAEELVYRKQNTHESFDVILKSFTNEVVQPTLYIEDGKTSFSSREFISKKGESTNYPSLSLLLMAYYKEKANLDRLDQIGKELIAFVKRELNKNQQKLFKLESDLQKTENSNYYQLRGELLTSYMHLIEPNSTKITLENYYNEGEIVTIALNPALTPSANAQKYFRQYNKLQKSISHLEGQIEQTLQEIDYFQSITNQIDLAQPEDLALIKQELIDEGYLRTNKSKKKQKPLKNLPLAFQLSDGTQILVGKNNRQNDELTTKTARKTDTWLHVKDIPGSHVILRHPDPSMEQIIEAAEIAAYYSKYRYSSNVPVDYTKVKDVHKPNGAKPGFVNYFEQKTVFVTPDESDVLSKQTK